MRVLADLHHEGLYKSLRMLFEGRLGGEVLRPVGMDWFDEGCWGYPHFAKETAAQFLGPGVYQHKGVTLSEFLGSWRAYGLMLSSTPDQWRAWENMRQTHGITIPHVFQSGNEWALPPCRNFLNSTTLPAPPGCHTVTYHQEFSLTDYYKPSAAEKPGRVISSFMHYNPRPDYFYALEREMPDWIFREYGAGGRDGQPADLTWAMRATRYLFHLKPVEAYGYNTFYAAACGVPIFMRVRQNQHQKIGEVLRAGETCLDLDDYVSPGHLADAIRLFDARHEEHSRAIYEAFREHVNFDAEEAKIRAWLETIAR